MKTPWGLPVPALIIAVISLSVLVVAAGCGGMREGAGGASDSGRSSDSARLRDSAGCLDPTDASDPAASSNPGGSPDTAGAEETTRVVIVEAVDFKFEPAVIAVAPGTRIVFVNRATTPHNVVQGTADQVARADHQPQFASPLLTQGDRWEVVLNQPGTYDFACTIASHYLLGMVGRIVVEEEA